MEETMQKQALTITQKNMLDFFQTHDVKYVAEDGIYRNLSTGETYKGRAEIGAMLHYIYHVAFDARADIKNYIITEDKAQLEAIIRGKHIGEFMGIAATNREVSVPVSVSYDLKDGLIKEARIYLLGETLMQQLGAPNTASRQKTTFLVRDIFRLKFGHFKEAKKLLDEAMSKQMMPETQQMRILTDFTGDSYRLIMEEGFEHLADYELSLSSSMHEEEWKKWYEEFKPHVESSHREILKQIS
jgi:predicted ester cyclase